jgi:hypothetical protein
MLSSALLRNATPRTAQVCNEQWGYTALALRRMCDFVLDGKKLLLDTAEAPDALC